MQNSKWIGIGAGLLIIVSGFLPWGRVPVPDVAPLTGFGSVEYTKFGKPVLFNIYLLPLLFLLFLLPQAWTKKINPLVAAISLAWALRNLLLFSTCRGGFCPTIDYGMYVYFGACLLLLVMTFFSVVPKKTTNN